MIFHISVAQFGSVSHILKLLGYPQEALLSVWYAGRWLHQFGFLNTQAHTSVCRPPFGNWLCLPAFVLWTICSNVQQPSRAFKKKSLPPICLIYLRDHDFQDAACLEHLKLSNALCGHVQCYFGRHMQQYFFFRMTKLQINFPCVFYLVLQKKQMDWGRLQSIFMREVAYHAQNVGTIQLGASYNRRRRVPAHPNKPSSQRVEQKSQV